MGLLIGKNWLSLIQEINKRITILGGSRMKTALDFCAKGKQKEANADEYDRSRDYSRDSNHFAY